METNKTHTLMHIKHVPNAWATNKQTDKGKPSTCQKEISKKYHHRNRSRGLHSHSGHFLGSVSGEMQQALGSSWHELSWGCWKQWQKELPSPALCLYSPVFLTPLYHQWLHLAAAQVVCDCVRGERRILDRILENGEWGEEISNAAAGKTLGARNTDDSS